MTDAAFDTLKAAEALREAGIEEAHAKAIASTMRDAVTEGVATKAAVADLKTEIAPLRWGLGFLAAAYPRHGCPPLRRLLGRRPAKSGDTARRRWPCHRSRPRIQPNTWSEPPPEPIGNVREGEMVEPGGVEPPTS